MISTNYWNAKILKTMRSTIVSFLKICKTHITHQGLKGNNEQENNSVLWDYRGKLKQSRKFTLINKGPITK